MSVTPAAVRGRSGPRTRVLGLLAVLLLAVTAAGCLPQQEQSFLDRTNALRRSAGIAQLKEHGTLSEKAEAWAWHMARDGSVSHSTLSAGLSGLAWKSLGENVGVAPPGPDPWLQVHNMFASSSGHRANLLNSKFTHMGVGVAIGADGRVWVVEVFAQL